MERRGMTLILLGLSMVLLAVSAQAMPVSYDFSVTATDGPLVGVTAKGRFTFDDSIIPPGGGTLNEIDLLSNLNFTWHGIAYDETTANTGWMRFDESGNLSQVAFGNDYDPGSLILTAGKDGWAVLVPPIGYAFYYTIPGTDGIYHGTTSIERVERVAEVDFDGDGATDVAAYHLPTNQFFVDYAGNLGQYGWGGADCYPVVWDYDGNGATDVSVYHIPTNQWFVRGYPGDNLGQFGWGGDESIPVPGDYNGDGIMERAFYHWPTNRWFVEGQDAVDFGWDGAAFIPLPGDYDGDGTTDMVAYHIPSNQWFQYGIGNLGQYGWGGTDCVPVPADYDGDGVTDIAVYHVPTNQWFVRGYPGDNLGQYGWGGGESFPIPGDYDGDGTVERGFYRYAENWWFIEGEADFVWGWGGAEFMPITSQIAVYNWFRFVLGTFQ